MEGNLKVWETLASRHIIKNSFLGLREDLCRAPELGEHKFYVLEFADWANIVALTQKQELILVRQFRHGMSQLNLEIPGGVVDPGEDAALAARRELAEETGYQAGKLELLSKVSVNPAIQNNWCHLFLATDCRLAGPQALDGTESIAVELFPWTQLPQMLAQGTIHNSLNCLALNLAWQKLNNLD